MQHKKIKIIVSSQQKTKILMITNREEVIDKAFKVFLKMNYEKASISTLAKACGLAKTGIVYYFPHKLELFMAVADKFFIHLQDPANKFDTPADTLAEFIEQYVAGVSKAMDGIVSLVNDGNNPYDCCPNFYYIHFLSQVRMYYPGIRQKLEDIFSKDYDMWTAVIQRAKDNGEIRSDVDVTTTARMFRQIFYGISYEHAFLNVLDTDELKENFKYLYSLLKQE